jgi:hypothetical protein
MMNWIETCIRQGFTCRQVLRLHQQEIMEASRLGIKPTRDTFIMPLDVQNIAKKRAQEMWENHSNDALSVRMWTEETANSVFIYQEYETLDLNEAPKEECTYTLGIQTEWQLLMMALNGHNNTVSFDTTFGINTPRIRPVLPPSSLHSSFSIYPVVLQGCIVP